MTVKRITRRYSEIVKFFKVTMANERLAHRVRMQAAERLTEIYEHAAARQDALQASQDTLERKLDRTAPVDSPERHEEGVPPQELSTATVEAQAFLAGIRKDQIERENGTDRTN
jgi:hypothetical protein